MMQLNPYSKYTQTNFAWLQKIPEGWEIIRGKGIFDCIDIRSSTGEEELLTVSSKNGVIPRNTTTVTMFKAASYVGYKMCWPNDLVINSLWAWAGGLGVSNNHGIISSAYGVYRLKASSNTLPRYIHELVRSAPFHWELQVRSKGIWTSRLQLTDQSFLDAPFHIPPFDEQKLIVRYLNYINSRISKYIVAKKKLIKLLEEQKQAIIHQAVTGAIDVRTGKPYSKYKGLLQISQLRIPFEWEQSKIKYVCSIHNGSDHKEIEKSSGYPVFGSGGQFSYASSFVYDKESVLFGRKGTIDKPLYVNEPFWTVDTMFYTKIYTNIIPKFLFFIAKTIPYQFYSTHTALPSMTQTILGNYRIGLPSLNIQKQIVNYIEEEIRIIDETIDLAKKEIELLQEYRTRVTADVVTGKVDVRDVAKDYPEEVEEVTGDLMDEEIIDEIEDINNLKE
jgi:type I restriction enzyme S subunit